MTCHHRNLPYREAHADAQRRLKLGQRQSQCPVCKLWAWPTRFFPQSPNPAKIGKVRKLKISFDG